MDKEERVGTVGGSYLAESATPQASPCLLAEPTATPDLKKSSPAPSMMGNNGLRVNDDGSKHSEGVAAPATEGDPGIADAAVDAAGATASYRQGQARRRQRRSVFTPCIPLQSVTRLFGLELHLTTCQLSCQPLSCTACQPSVQAVLSSGTNWSLAVCCAPCRGHVA